MSQDGNSYIIVHANNKNFKRIWRVVNSIILIGLMSESHKNDLLYEIKSLYMVFLEDFPRGFVREDIPKAEKILGVSREKISMFDYPIPRAMVYHVTSRCDKFCKYCYLNANNSPLETDLLSKSEIFTIIDQMRELAIPKIIYTGGEPFMYPGFIDILGYASQKGIYNSVTTKHYFTEYEAEQLGKMGMVKIALSYDSHISYEADYLSGCKEHAKKMDRSIRFLLDNNVDLSIEPVVTGVNVNSMQDFLEHLRSLGVKKIELHRYVKSGERHNDKLTLTKEQWDYVLNLFTINKKNIPDLCLYSESIELHNIEDNNLEIGCVNGIVSFSMLPNGTVVLCDHMPNPEDYSYGNLRYQTIEEVWNSEQRLKIINPKRTDFVNTKCENCQDFSACLKKTACRKQSLLQHGNINVPSSLTEVLCRKFSFER